MELKPLTVQPGWETATERDWAMVLAEVPPFAGVRRRRLRKLARSARVAEFPPGTAVVSTGELADAVYVILSGKAEARCGPAARALCAGDY